MSRIVKNIYIYISCQPCIMLYKQNKTNETKQTGTFSTLNALINANVLLRSEFGPNGENEFEDDDDDEDEEEDYDSINDPDHSKRRKTVPIMFTVMVIISYVIIGTFLFNAIENWTLVNSAYFSFATLSSIGFGDFVSGLESSSKTIYIELGLFLCITYAYFGIALNAMSFKLIIKEIRRIKRLILRKKLEKKLKKMLLSSGSSSN